MKKILSILTTLTIVLSFAAVPVSAEEIVPCDNWLAATNNTATVSLVTSETAAVSGLSITGNALQLQVGSSTDSEGSATAHQWAIAKTPVTGIENGKTYKLTGKIYTFQGYDGTSLLLTGKGNWENNGTYRVARLVTVAGAAKKWETVEYTFTNTKASSSDAFNYLSFAVSSNGVVLVDDLSLKEVETDADGVTRYSEELITNGDFDTVEPEIATGKSGPYRLSGVSGWNNSYWEISAADTYLNGNVELLTDVIGTPEGRGMLKLTAPTKTSDSSGAGIAWATQELQNLDTTKRYLLTGDVKYNSNNVFVRIPNTDTLQSRKQMYAAIVGGSSTEDQSKRNTWQELSLEFTPTETSVNLQIYAETGRKAYLDCLSVKEIEKDSDGNIVKYGEELLVNGNFEDSFKTGMTAGEYPLSDVAGWDVLSNWNIPADGYEAGIDLLENIAGTPEGNNMLKIWAGAPTGTANLNANAVQQIKLDKEKTYRLTGKVKYDNNDTYIYLGNTDFNDGKQIQLQGHFGDGRNGIWNDLSIDFKPSNVSVELRFTVAANRKVWIDALSVKEVLYNSEGEEIGLGDTEYLVNGNFEGIEIVEPVFEATKTFYPADGEEILDLTAQQNITEMISTYGTNTICARAAIKNTKYDEKSVNVYLAVYKGGVLDDVVMTTAPLAKSETVQNVDVFYTLPSDLTDAVYSCKLFVWDTDMVPTGESGEIAE